MASMQKTQKLSLSFPVSLFFMWSEMTLCPAILMLLVWNAWHQICFCFHSVSDLRIFVYTLPLLIWKLTKLNALGRHGGTQPWSLHLEVGGPISHQLPLTPAIVWPFLGRHKYISIDPRQGTSNRLKKRFHPHPGWWTRVYRSYLRA